MLWGLIIDSNKRYTQTIEQTFHISMASLDLSNSSPGPVQVSVYDHESKLNYLLCTLSKESPWQQPLDLNFQEGKKISFSCNGNGRVHLTGFLVPDDDDTFDDEIDGESEDDEVPTLLPIEKKRKAKSGNDEMNKSKKSKLDKSSVIDESDSDDDEDEDNEEMGPLSFEYGSDEDEDDDDEEEEEDDGEDDEEEEEEEEKKEKITKKPTKNQGMANGKPEKETKQKKNKEKKDNSKVEEKSEQPQKKKTVEGGVQIEELRVGHGAPAKLGKFVGVYYVGKLKNGKKFDQTMTGDGFKFKLGKGEVIKGWDVGIVGMKVGGKRRIVIPPGMAYGAKGSPPVIPPHSQLIFEVELKSVN